MAHTFVFLYHEALFSLCKRIPQRKRRSKERRKINDPRKKSFHTAIDINLLIINYIKTRRIFFYYSFTFCRSTSYKGKPGKEKRSEVRDKCFHKREGKGYSYTLWCNICKLLCLPFNDIDLFTIFSQTNFFSFFLLHYHRPSQCSTSSPPDSFYFSTLF